MVAETNPTRRPYSSPRRDRQAAQTRAAVLEAATALFRERGWAGTAIREVARQAEVSVETVYAAFGSKVGLLKAALDNSVVGDAADAPLAERSEFALIGVGTLEDRATAAAALVRQVNERTSGLRKALSEGASSEVELATLKDEAARRSALDVDRGVRMITDGDVDKTAVSGIWAVASAEVYQLLTEQAGWSPKKYERWLAETIIRLLAPCKGESK